VDDVPDAVIGPPSWVEPRQNKPFVTHLIHAGSSAKGTTLNATCDGVLPHHIGSLARFQIGEASCAAAWAFRDVLVDHEIAVATFDIRAALWAGNIELAKLLISKRTGLRIRPGERSVKLKSPAAPMRAQRSRLAGGARADPRLGGNEFTISRDKRRRMYGQPPVSQLVPCLRSEFADNQSNCRFAPT
jgi:hypothetical protein